MKNPVRLAIEIVGGVLILCIGISIGRAESKNTPLIYSTTSATSQSTQSTQKMIDNIVNMDEYQPGRYELYQSGTGDATLREIETDTLSVIKLTQKGPGKTSAFDDERSNLFCALGDESSKQEILQPHTKYRIRIQSDTDWEVEVYAVKAEKECMFKGSGNFVTHMFRTTTREFNVYVVTDEYFTLSFCRADGKKQTVTYGTGTYSNRITVPKDEEICFQIVGDCKEVSIKPIY